MANFPKHRAYVGPPDFYDRLGAMQFSLLTLLGMREHHRVLDVGCGSLRVGRLLIPFLQEERYYGIDPNRWLIEDAMKYEIAGEAIQNKKPTFLFDGSLTLSHFMVRFDYLLAISICTAPLKLDTKSVLLN
jgi:SAM-dependent methyltransferase